MPVIFLSQLLKVNLLLTRIFQLIQYNTYTYGRGVDKSLTINFKNMTNQKEKNLINFKKARGLILKIIKMVEANEYCIDIMQQNSAVIGLLKSAHQMLMENHLNTCFKTAMGTKNEKRKREMTQEILKVTKLFNK